MDLYTTLTELLKTHTMAEIQEALYETCATMEEFATADEIERAESQWRGCNVDFDEGPVPISRENDGAWVQAWVWIDNPDDE